MQLRFSRDVLDKAEEDNEIGKIGSEIEIASNLFKVTSEEWEELVSFQMDRGFIMSDKEVSIPQKAQADLNSLINLALLYRFLPQSL